MPHLNVVEAQVCDRLSVAQQRPDRAVLPKPQERSQWFPRSNSLDQVACRAFRPGGYVNRRAVAGLDRQGQLMLLAPKYGLPIARILLNGDQRVVFALTADPKVVAGGPEQAPLGVEVGVDHLRNTLLSEIKPGELLRALEAPENAAVVKLELGLDFHAGLFSGLDHQRHDSVRESSAGCKPRV